MNQLALDGGERSRERLGGVLDRRSLGTAGQERKRREGEDDRPAEGNDRSLCDVERPEAAARSPVAPTERRVGCRNAPQLSASSK